MSNNLQEPELNHPQPLDRNRAIIWARNLLEIPDWVAVACKKTLNKSTANVSDTDSLISIAVIAANEMVLIDSLVRPFGSVSNELIQEHGADSAHVFNAPDFTELYEKLEILFSKRQILCWNYEQTAKTLQSLCRRNGLADLSFKGQSLDIEYSRYIGNLNNTNYSYNILPLPKGSCEQAGVSALAEVENVRELLFQIAGSSQVSDSALTFNKNWSAAFYKPKLSPAQKIKSFLGLEE